MLNSWLKNLSPQSQKWLTVVSVVFDYGIALAVFFIGQRIGDEIPRQQTFSVLDPTISFPYRPGNTISATNLYLISFVLPVVAILLWCSIFQSGAFIRRLLVLNYSLVGLCVAFACTGFITEILKWTVGRPRPEWLDRCQPDLAKVQAALKNASTTVTMFDRSICTNTDQSLVDDGQRSFPSGHASYSFAGLTYLALFLAARFKLFVPMERRRTHALLVFIAFSPMFVAGYVGATRVSDFRHRGDDVLAGSVLGAIIALIVYRHWHPWLTDRSAATPWDVLRMDEIKHRASAEVLPSVHPKDERYTQVEA